MSISSKLLFLIVLGFSFLVVPPALAKYGLEDTQKATGDYLPKGIAGKTDVTEVVGAVVNIALGLIGIIFFLLVLYAGFSWMTAMGNTEKVTKAKEMIEMAVIGLILVMASYAIARFVFDQLGGSGSEPGSSCGANTLETPCLDAGCQWDNQNSVCIEKTTFGSPDSPAPGDCSGASDGTDCGDSKICVGKQCVIPCDFSYQGASCIDTGKGGSCQSPKITTSGLCPGATTICCHDP